MNLKTKNALIGGLLAIVFVMAIGYAAFAQQLTINGNAEITSTWDVQIESIAATGQTGTGADVPYAAGTAEDGTQKVNATQAQFKADLKSPGDSVTYTVTVRNNGTIAAQLNTATPTPQENDAPITYTTTANDLLTQELAAGATQTFTVTATYDDVTAQPETTEKSYTLTLDYGQFGV